MLLLRLAPLAGTRLQAMEDDPAASEQVLAAAQQAQANFEALQSFLEAVRNIVAFDRRLAEVGGLRLSNLPKAQDIGREVSMHNRCGRG